MSDDKKKKVKKLINKLKEKAKTVGHPKIDNVKDPDKPKPKKKEESEESKKPKEVNSKKLRMIGPKGGVYETTAGGKKKYDSKVKKALEGHLAELETIEKIIDDVKKSKD